MVTSTETERVRRILETNRVWCAYALADLDPSQAVHSEWLVGANAVVLIYRGLETPVLFAHGSPVELTGLLDQVPEGAYQYTLMGADRTLLAGRLVAEREVRMWRMALRPSAFQAALAEGAIPLGQPDLPEILELFNDDPDRPDAFHERQLREGVFFGVRHEGRLAGLAGTHILSVTHTVGAIGNVFTRPDLRNRGFATRATAAVVRALLERGVTTIVLNVAMDNEPAIRSYRRLGFWPFCGYDEGIGRLGPAVP
jgi:RimJ/RimL family protein N-acetyltransferase